MKPLRLGVILDQQIRAGGGYQQELNAAMVVKQLPANLVEPVYFTTYRENINTLSELGIFASYLHISKFHLVLMTLRRLIQSNRLLNVVKRFDQNNLFERALISQDIDLVYFLSPSSRARDLEQLNYITTVWDLCHRDNPEFPEVRSDRILEARESYCQTVLPKATAIIVDSELGKVNVLRRYGIDHERVHMIPFQASVVIRERMQTPELCSFDVKKKYRLDDPYIFYPAQFWAHKNHIYLLEGLKLLEAKHGLIIGAIFAGGDCGNADYVQAYSGKLGLSDRIRFTGFVSNVEIPHLYKHSLALVMPTYFGPTNLPPLEAFELGVPVLYPDKAGLREQVGDAALLMDLKNPESMADLLKKVIEDESVRENLKMAGRARLLYFDSFDRVDVLRTVIEDFRWRRLSWR